MQSPHGWSRVYRGRLVEEKDTLRAATINMWINSQGDKIRLYRNYVIVRGEFQWSKDRDAKWVLTSNFGKEESFSSKEKARAEVQSWMEEANEEYDEELDALPKDFDLEKNI